MKTNQLHLILTHYWYDMIESGAKRVEYRDCTMRYARLLQGKTEVIFHKGYTTTIMRFKITRLRAHIINERDIRLEIAPKEWLGRMVYAIDFKEMEEENEAQILD